MSLKKGIIDRIIEVEGGYVDDPSDSGGETNWGITKATADAYGYKGEMNELPRSTAFKIYEDRYWASLKLDTIEKLSFGITKELCDTGVNMGISRATKFLQRSLTALNYQEKYSDLVVDGQIGNKTITALRVFLDLRENDGEEVLLKILNGLQIAAYVDLTERRKKDRKFLFGWIRNRIKID